MTNLFQSPTAERLEQDRAEARSAYHHGSHSKGRLTYDCFNALVSHDRERVYCAEGNLLGLGKDGTVRLAQVLRGTKMGACQKCEDYDGD